MGKKQLDGWKEISDYLNRDVRTCQRWELELGLPVYRVKKDSLRSKVFGYTTEIDEWFSHISKSDSLEKKQPELKKWFILSLLVIVILAVFIGVFSFIFSKNNQKSSGSNLNPAPTLCGHSRRHTLRTGIPATSI